MYYRDKIPFNSLKRSDVKLSYFHYLQFAHTYFLAADGLLVYHKGQMSDSKWT